MTRLLTLALLSLAALRAADPQPSTEDRLRARIGEFYQDIKDKKFRDAEPLIAPEDRDAYYNHSKPDLRAFSVQKIEWSDDHKIAHVTMSAKTMLEHAQVGRVEMPGSFLCHWKYENGDWWWFIPQDEYHDTPFGKMHFVLKKGASAETNQQALAALIAHGPSASAFVEAVKPGGTTLKLDAVEGSTASVTLTNTSKVLVQLTIGGLDTKAFTVQLTAQKLAPGETATLTATRSVAAKFQPLQFAVTVEPTQQRLIFEVQ